MFALSLHFHSTCKLQKILIHLQTLTSQARESFGMLSQSFFLLAPCVALAIKRISYRSGSHTEVSLVFFSTFEPIALSPDHVMQAEKQVPMLYKNSERNLSTLYVCSVGNVLGRAPLTPCYMSCNTHPTIPYCFRGGNLGGAKAIPDQTMGQEASCLR